IGQRVYTGRSSAAMRYVVQHLIQRSGGAVVEEGLRKREEREQRRRHVPVSPEWRRRILPDLVERRRIEGSHVPQLTQDLSARIQDPPRRRRRKPNPRRGPLRAAVTLLAVGRGEQRPARDHIWTRLGHWRNRRPDTELDVCLDRVPAVHAAHLQ